MGEEKPEPGQIDRKYVRSEILETLRTFNSKYIEPAIRSVREGDVYIGVRREGDVLKSPGTKLGNVIKSLGGVYRELMNRVDYFFTFFGVTAKTNKETGETTYTDPKEFWGGYGSGSEFVSDMIKRITEIERAASGTTTTPDNLNELNNLLIGESGLCAEFIRLSAENQRLRRDLEYDRTQYLSVLSKLAERLGDDEFITSVREFKARIEGRYGETESQQDIDKFLEEGTIIPKGEMIIEERVDPPEDQKAGQALVEAGIGEDVVSDEETKPDSQEPETGEKSGRGFAEPEEEEDPPF